MMLLRTRSASISTRPLRIAPSTRHENSNWDCALAVELALCRQPLKSPGTMSRTSFRGHAMRTAADPGTPRLAGRIPCHLLHPRLVWVPRYRGQADAAALQMNEEQNIVGHQAAPSKDLNREEVDPRQHGQMRLNEFLPRGSLAAFWRRRDAMPPQNVSHGLIRDDVAEIGQRAHDPVVAPARILPCHLHNQRLQFRLDFRPTGIAAVFGSIELLRDELSVPSQNGVRLGNTGHLRQRLSAEALTNLSERGPFRIG